MSVLYAIVYGKEIQSATYLVCNHTLCLYYADLIVAEANDHIKHDGTGCVSVPQ